MNVEVLRFILMSVTNIIKNNIPLFSMLFKPFTLFFYNMVTNIIDDKKFKANNFLIKIFNVFMEEVDNLIKKITNDKQLWEKFKNFFTGDLFIMWEQILYKISGSTEKEKTNINIIN